MPFKSKKRKPAKRTTLRRTRAGEKKPRKRTAWVLSFVAESLRTLDRWQKTWAEFAEDETIGVSERKIRETLQELMERLKDNYPFFHPSYAGQMLKPPPPVASIAYFLTQQINPNNHALDGGPATAKMEFEVVGQLARMFGYGTHLGHLTSSGTIANLEALWVARSLHPEKAIAFSSEAHYTHRRMCDVIGARAVEIGVDDRGRMDLDDLMKKSREENIGTVVLTAGTTGLGAVDPVNEVLELQREFGFRIHVDAAYGGFFSLLTESPGLLSDETCRAFRAISKSDSVVVDPHKHGLQPYGCGSVIFRDPAVGTLYKHDSPYTYFTSTELHLGEISLECSRAGASAAALWATLKCFPLNGQSGLGAVLTKTRKAAIEFARALAQGPRFRIVTDPALDIVSYFAVGGDKQVSSVSKETERIFRSTMTQKVKPIYLAKMALKPALLARYSDLIWDQPTVTVLRSVLMKPEQLAYVPQLYAQLLKAAK